ncbi:MAG: hypothetical protein A3K09_07330 [Nitrospinae bacterium RIFCSPLOWO2_12_FULL_47_7]|nr:MAG: hypothetical protein A3K09_07330 [Nitrospinae bacterium RIFCSPLOWO2_12_FULL_47_7]
MSAVQPHNKYSMTSFDVITQLVELTSNATNAFTAALYSLDPNKKTMSVRAYMSLSTHFDAEACFSYGKGPIGLVARNKAPLLLENSEDEISKMKIYKRKELLKGFLAIPVVHDEIEGVLVVDSKEIYSFSTKMQKVLAGFAEQMAWHLHREKQSLIRPKEEIFPYQEMLNYNQTLAGLTDPAAIAEQLLNIPSTIFSCDAMALIWFDQEGGLGRVVRHRGWGMNLTDLQILPGKGIIGSCAKNKTPLWVEDTEDRKAVLFIEKENMDEFKARLVVPILSNNQLLGIVACASKKPAGLTHTHLNRLALVVSYVASTMTSLKIKQQWEYAKNLDAVTGIPNHRFLADYRRSIETEILNQHKSVFALMIHLKNLPTLYETFGVEMGDSFLQQVVAILSNALPAPKHMFKYSDAAFLALLMQVKREEAYHLENRLKLVFDENPIYVNGKAMTVIAELGLSSFPEDGKNLGEIIGVAWNRTSHRARVAS